MSKSDRGHVGRGYLPPRHGAGAPPQPGAQGPPGAQAVPQPGAQPQPQPQPSEQAQPQPPGPVQPPPRPQTQPPAQPKGRGRGRGRGYHAPPPMPQGIAPAAQPATGKPLLMLGVPRHLQIRAAQPDTPPPKVVSERTGMDRAALHRGGATAAGEGSADTAQMTKQASKLAITKADKTALLEAAKREHFRRMRLSRRWDYDDVETNPTIEKTGSEGKQIVLTTNYFKFSQTPDYHLHQYHVDFNPPVEGKKAKETLLYQHKNTLGTDLYLVFDGMLLFTRSRLEKTPLELASKGDKDEFVTIIIRGTGEVAQTSPEFIQVMNMQMRNALGMLKLHQVGRHFFDFSKPTDIENRAISVLPGFITAVKYHENGLLLGVDITHKVLRRETALDILRRMQRDGKNETEMTNALVGSVVLTGYNNRTYRIDGVSFEENPTSTFKKDGENVSFVQYYQERHKVTITNFAQPMLMSNPKVRDIRGGRTDKIYLVPELCTMTGLTRAQRNDWGMMKAVTDVTRVDPDKRIVRILGFQKELCQNPRTNQLLKTWEIVPQSDLLETQARVLPQQEIMMNDPRNPKRGELLKFDADKPDWSKQMKSFHMSLSVPLKKWIVCFVREDRDSALEIVQTVIWKAREMGMTILKPTQIVSPRGNPSIFSQTISNAIKSEVQMVMAVVADKRKERYDAIKNVCCLLKPCPSQVVCANIKKQVLGSVCSKIAIQMNCKLGGIPWTATVPLTDTMFIGIDTFHDSAQQKKSAVGFVATLDKNMTQFFCDSTIQEIKGEELANTLASFVKLATTEFKNANDGRKPQRYFIYRDGVGDGMLRIVNDYEKKQVVDAIKELYKGEPAAKRPVLFFFVVKKRILTRLFTKKEENPPPGTKEENPPPGTKEENPPPGTVVDRDITTKFWFDFFLISQRVNHGTVSPVHYNCIEMPRVDELCLSADHLQQLTYRLCHLYYNWAGTIRVPSICMYAHKLAFLVGQSLHRPPDAKLCNRLFFL